MTSSSTRPLFLSLCFGRSIILAVMDLLSFLQCDRGVFRFYCFVPTITLINYRLAWKLTTEKRNTLYLSDLFFSQMCVGLATI